jgi:hypothetical protein
MACVLNAFILPAATNMLQHALFIMHALLMTVHGSKKEKTLTLRCSLQPWAAIMIGFLAGGIYVGASRLVSHVLKIDDPLDAVAVHCGCGVWGLIAAALFAAPAPTRAAYPNMGDKYGALQTHAMVARIALPSATSEKSNSVLY